jgi:hypothetical protein
MTKWPIKSFFESQEGSNGLEPALRSRMTARWSCQNFAPQETLRLAARPSIEAHLSKHLGHPRSLQCDLPQNSPS